MITSASDRIVVDSDGPVVRLTIGAGIKHNAMRTDDWRELARIFESLAGDDRLRGVLIKGRDRTFSAGSDMREWLGADLASADESFAEMERAFCSVETLPVPVVAAVSGVATGAGCQLALACDVRVVEDQARIGMPIARLGVLVSPAFAGRLSRLAGAGLARYLLYTGGLLTGAEAYRHGLAERCVADGEAETGAEEIVASIAALPPSAIRAAKAATSPALARAADHSVDYPAFLAGVNRFFASRQASPPSPATPGAA